MSSDSDSNWLGEPVVDSLLLHLKTATGVKGDTDALKDLLLRAHGGRQGHWGLSKTCKLLSELYPGHKIPVRIIADFIATCPICQKERLAATHSITPLIRHLKPAHKRSRIGMDDLTITPVDKYGNGSITVIVNHYTKHVYGYATPPHPNEIQIAQCLFQYYTTFGRFEEIITDPASNYQAAAVQQLNSWLSVDMKVSLVDRHESNGVEGTNKSILRHLRCLVADERVSSEWSAPHILPWVFYLINSSLNSETGTIPFEATFGETAKIFMELKTDLDDVAAAHEYIKLLDQSFLQLKNISDEHQGKIIKERLSRNPPPERRNEYQAGDLVLVLHNPHTFRDNKLHLRYDGPYNVISQYKNDLTVESLIDGRARKVHVENCKLFLGSHEEAFRVAQLDHDQHLIDRITAYRGDVWLRTSLSFEVLFADGSTHWVPWSNDIVETVQFLDYVRDSSNLELYHLQFDSNMAKKFAQQINKQPITAVKPGSDTYFINLRTWGEKWYQDLQLPDMYHIKYVMEVQYVKWGNKERTKIICKSLLTGEVYRAESHWWVFAYGTYNSFDNATMVLVDDEFASKYPAILPQTVPTVQK